MRHPIPTIVLTGVLLGACSDSSDGTPSDETGDAASAGGVTTPAGTGDADGTPEGGDGTTTADAGTAGGDTVATGTGASGDGAVDGTATAATEEGSAAGGEGVSASAAATSARYRLTFEATWSEATHPLDFPSSSAHFSGLIGAVHNEQVVFWEGGQIASDGIERMAETGGKGILRTELQAAVDAGAALSLIDGGGVGTSPGTVEVEFEVTLDYPEITLVTMIAPSPDWFAGVHNLRLHDGDAFVPSLTRDLIVYDAGTDDGATYTAGNADTQPRGTIAPLTSDPVDAPFVDGEPGIGRFVITRL